MTQPIVGMNYLFIDHEGQPDYLTITEVSDNLVWYKIESYRNPLPMARTLWDSENYPAVDTVALEMTRILAQPESDALSLDEIRKQAEANIKEQK